MGSIVAVPADKVAITNQTDYCGNNSINAIDSSGGFTKQSLEK